MRRFDGSGDYNRNWDEYKHGFGDANGEYWLGNEYLHYLTNSRAYNLRFDLEDWDGNTAYAEYSSFVVESEADNYRLRLGDYSGNASDDRAEDEARGFLYHNNTQFSTYDRDNDNHDSSSCVVKHDYGGFWFNACSKIEINNNDCRAASCSIRNRMNRWKAWRGTQYSLMTMQMMFRPI